MASTTSGLGKTVRRPDFEPAAAAADQGLRV
jgi:hypothetical protein